MAFRVVLTARLPFVQDEEECRKIEAELFPIPCDTEDELIAATQDADAVLTNSPQPFTSKVLSKLNKCKLIHNLGTGYDGIDVQAATDYGICVSFPGDYCVDEVAEHTVALILACARKVVRLDRVIRRMETSIEHDSVAQPEIRKIWPPLFQIKGQTLGLIGFGRIGRLVVSKAKGFGFRVIAFDPYLPSNVFKESGAESVTLDKLLSESDFISVHAALTEENRHLLGIEQFKKMKPTAYLINCARGGIADEEALCTALANGYIAGAGLDVVTGESLSLEHRLRKLENVILTGHSAWYSEHSMSELKRRAYEHLGQVFRGEWPTWLLNPEVKEKFLERWRKT